MTSLSDNLLLKLIRNINQLMVTTFLFYSGYGIMRSIKSKANYVKNFPKKRIFPLWFKFLIGIALFIIMDFALCIKYPVKDIILSITGYSSVGNSNWFIFTTFVFYIFVLICFNNKMRKSGDIKSLSLFTVLSLAFIAIGSFVLPNRFVNTAICFPLGMWFAHYKDNIQAFICKRYYLNLIIAFMTFIILFIIRKKFSLTDNNLFYSIYSISFIMFLVALSMKFSFNNIVFEFFGRYVFWIYVLQRIPMICLEGKINNSYIYFTICLIITIMFSVILEKISSIALNHSNQNKHDDILNKEYIL